ncbi:MAG: hypothetical protein AB7V46_16380 [Thermomicrobiales bacterium]
MWKNVSTLVAVAMFLLSVSGAALTAVSSQINLTTKVGEISVIVTAGAERQKELAERVSAIETQVQQARLALVTADAVERIVRVAISETLLEVHKETSGISARIKSLEDRVNAPKK